MKKFILVIKIVFFIAFSSVVSVNAEEYGWCQVRIPVACIRDGKGHSTEMTSQAIMGTPLMILDEEEDWLHIKSPDGYEGYMNISSVEKKTEKDIDKWRGSRRYVSTSIPEIKLYLKPTLEKSSNNILTEMVLSSIVEGEEVNDSVLSLIMPDGRSGYAASKDFELIETWAQRPLDTDSIISTAYWLMGAPYLWGACSTKSVDCSGLVRVCYFANGILTLRDARQQIKIGKRIEPEELENLRRGDLLFFSNTPDGRISHVALYDKDGKYIHSSGLVKTNYMTAEDPDYMKRYFRGASRIDGMEDTEGIVRIINHPWYFNK